MFGDPTGHQGLKLNLSGSSDNAEMVAPEGEGIKKSTNSTSGLTVSGGPSTSTPSIAGGIYVHLRIPKSEIYVLEQRTMDSLNNRTDPTGRNPNNYSERNGGNVGNYHHSESKGEGIIQCGGLEIRGPNEDHKPE